MIVRLGAVAVFAASLAFTAAAQDKKKDAKDPPADKPQNRDIPRHKEFLKKVSSGEGDVIFLGDSITQGWEGKDARPIWADAFGPFKPVNLGIGGDRTGHVLWRITEGKEIEPLKPKLAVIMIGTNNTGAHSAAEIAAGIRAILDELRKQKPEMKILLLGVFPRGPNTKGVDVVPADKLNPKINQINDLISKYADDKMIFYKNINKEFLNADGGLDRKVMPDMLHLSGDGYAIWAKAIKGDVAKLVK